MFCINMNKYYQNTGLLFKMQTLVTLDKWAESLKLINLGTILCDVTLSLISYPS